MNGTEIITILENNAPLIKSAVSAVTGSLLTAIFLRHNTAAEEFEKIKAGHFKEVADDLLATGKMTYTEYYKANNFLNVAKKADEAALGFHHHFRENAGIIVPLPETFQISVSPFIINDEGHHIVPQAFLEHNQPTDSAVAILKGENPLKAHMEAQNVPALYLRQRFIFRNQGFQLRADLFSRQHEGYFAGGFWASVLPRCNPFPAVIYRTKDELVMEILNEFRGQRFLRMVKDVVNADTVVQAFHPKNPEYLGFLYFSLFFAVKELGVFSKRTFLP